MRVLNLFNKDSFFKVYFLRLTNGTYHIVKAKRINKESKLIKLGKEKTFKIDLGLPAFLDKNKIQNYFFDIDSGEQLTFNKIKTSANPEDLDIIVSQKIVKELTKGVMSDKKKIITWILIGILIGGLLVGMIMSIRNQKLIRNIYDSLDEDSEVIPMGAMEILIKTMRMI